MFLVKKFMVMRGSREGWMGGSGSLNSDFLDSTGLNWLWKCAIFGSIMQVTKSSINIDADCWASVKNADLQVGQLSFSEWSTMK